MEKKSEILIGGSMHDHAVALSGPAPDAPSEEITTVDNPRRRSSVPPAPSPENAAALRQIRGEPDPIPEGKLYTVQAFGPDGKQIQGKAAAPSTHADAVEACRKANEGAPADVWFGVVVAGEL